MASVLATQTFAQELPEQIRVVVPVAAGSSLDARARLVVDALGKRLQRRIIVDNRPGAGGTLGALAVARSKPDAATLLFVNNSHVISPHIYRDTGYDPIKDFVAVASVYESGMVLVAHPDLRVTSVKELVAYARSQREPLNYASSGTGGLPHLAMEMFMRSAGIALTHVAYKGDGQAMSDVLPGRVPLLVSGYPAALPHIKAGTLRALAVTSSARTAILPEVPTLTESGLPAATLGAWTGFFAPARTPQALVDKLNREISAVLTSASMQETLAITGAQAWTSSPAGFATFVAAESQRYGKLVRELGLKGE